MLGMLGGGFSNDIRVDNINTSDIEIRKRLSVPFKNLEDPASKKGSIAYDGELNSLIYSDGIQWLPVSTGEGGGVTRVDTGVGIEGGPITTTGTISLEDTTVSPGIYSNPTLTVDQKGRLVDVVEQEVLQIDHIDSKTPNAEVTIKNIGIKETTITSGGTTKIYSSIDSPGEMVVGGSSLSVQLPTFDVQGGNLRGPNTIDLQYIRGSPDQVPLATCSAIVGGRNNKIGLAGQNSVIAGGFTNSISGTLSSFIGGGSNNQITSGQYGFIGGGENNISSGTHGFIGGGRENNVLGGFGSSCGGAFLEVGTEAFAGGGYANKATGGKSCIIGGNDNEASGICSVVLGGEWNVAGDAHAIAAGRRSRALHSGSMVFSDAMGEETSSTDHNQLTLKFANGVNIISPNISSSPSLNVTGKSTRYIREMEASSLIPFLSIQLENKGYYAKVKALGKNTDGSIVIIREAIMNSFAGITVEDPRVIKSGSGGFETSEVQFSLEGEYLILKILPGDTTPTNWTFCVEVIET